MGSKIEAKDNGERTALHWAAYMKNAQIVDILVTAKADIEARDNGERTPLHLAALHFLIPKDSLSTVENSCKSGR